MICVSVMLAILQIWPMMFGHDGNQAIAAEPVTVVATPQPLEQKVAVLPVPQPVVAGESRVEIPPMESCLSAYRRALNECRHGDSGCSLRVSDRWQVCEATGF
jgi:hypothetical protein